MGQAIVLYLFGLKSMKGTNYVLLSKGCEFVLIIAKNVAQASGCNRNPEVSFLCLCQRPLLFVRKEQGLFIGNEYFITVWFLEQLGNRYYTFSACNDVINI